jgi:hypothetical protein
MNIFYPIPVKNKNPLKMDIALMGYISILSSTRSGEPFIRDSFQFCDTPQNISTHSTGNIGLS